MEQGRHAPWLLVAVATLGNSLGGLVTWGMGYWVARRFPLRRLSPRQQRARDWLQRHGTPALLLSWLPLIGDPLCFIGGWLRLGFPLSTLMIALGKALRYGALAAGGQLL